MDRKTGAIIANMQSDVALIPQLAGYLIASGGKRFQAASRNAGLGPAVRADPRR